MMRKKKLAFIFLFIAFSCLLGGLEVSFGQESSLLIDHHSMSNKEKPCIKIQGYVGNPLLDVPNFLLGFFWLDLFSRKEVDVVVEASDVPEKRLSKSSLISRAYSYAVMIAKNIDRYRDGFEVDGLSIGGQIGIYLIDILNFYRTGKAVDYDVARVCKILEKKYAYLNLLDLESKFNQLLKKSILLRSFVTPISFDVDTISNSESFFELIKEHVHFFHDKDLIAVADPGFCSRKMFMTRNFSFLNNHRKEILIKFFDHEDNELSSPKIDFHNSLLGLVNKLKEATMNQPLILDQQQVLLKIKRPLKYLLPHNNYLLYTYGETLFELEKVANAAIFDAQKRLSVVKNQESSTSRFSAIKKLSKRVRDKVLQKLLNKKEQEQSSNEVVAS